MRYSIIFFCLIACCTVIIPLNAQDYSEAAQKARELTNKQLAAPIFDTVPLAPYIQEDFAKIVSRWIQLRQELDALEYQINLIARSHGIKPEEMGPITHKSILKRKK